MSADERLLEAIRFLGAVNERIGRAGRLLAGAMLAAMTGVVMLQVVARYGLNNSLSWTEEFSKTLMVWTAFLVAPWAYRHGANVSIDMFVDAMGARMQTLLRLIITALILWIVAVLFLESFPFIERGFKARASALPVSTGVFYLIVPISLAALFSVGCEQFLREVAALRGADPPPLDHLARREA